MNFHRQIVTRLRALFDHSTRQGEFSEVPEFRIQELPEDGFESKRARHETLRVEASASGIEGGFLRLRMEKVINE